MSARESMYLECLLRGDREQAALLAIAPPSLRFGDEPEPSEGERAVWVSRGRWWARLFR